MSALPIGTRIYTVLNHVSKSGNTRALSLYIVNDDKELQQITGLVATALDLPINAKHGGVTVKGNGMDMGFNTVYLLGRTLHDDGYAFTHSWL
mgnify:CR=1 FL=1